jgi:hypothetical protein
MPITALPLRLTARQLLDLRLFRAASVVAGLFRILGLGLFARGAAGFLAFFFAECLCVCHEYSKFLYLKNSVARSALRSVHRPAGRANLSHVVNPVAKALLDCRRSGPRSHNRPKNPDSVSGRISCCRCYHQQHSLFNTRPSLEQKTYECRWQANPESDQKPTNPLKLVVRVEAIPLYSTCRINPATATNVFFRPVRRINVRGMGIKILRHVNPASVTNVNARPLGKSAGRQASWKLISQT